MFWIFPTQTQLPFLQCTLCSIKYAPNFVVVILWVIYIYIHYQSNYIFLLIFHSYSFLALGQSYYCHTGWFYPYHLGLHLPYHYCGNWYLDYCISDCPSFSESTLKDVGKINQSQTKTNNKLHTIPGMYRTNSGHVQSSAVITHFNIVRYFINY